MLWPERGPDRSVLVTKEELAAKLNGREYGHEITGEEAKEAAFWGLIAIFGASDDLVELRGLIDDEVGAWNGTTVLIDRTRGELLPAIERDDEEALERCKVLAHARRVREEAVKIDARWCATDEYRWTFETTQPHATFDILEDGEKFCRGIVIDLREKR